MAHFGSTGFVAIGDGRIRLMTTSFILAECGNAAARRPFRAEADQMREEFEKAGTLIWPTSEDWKQAWNAYRKGEADSAGIVDQISFAVMRRMGLSKVLHQRPSFPRRRI